MKQDLQVFKIRYFLYAKYQTCLSAAYLIPTTKTCNIVWYYFFYALKTKKIYLLYSV